MQKLSITGLRRITGLAIGTLIGYSICKFPLLRMYKKRLLSTWIFPERRNRIDNFFYEKCLLPAWFRFEYLAEKNPNKRESLKELCMGGEGGRRWAEIYDSRSLDFEGMVGDMSGKEACPLLPKLDEILSKAAEPLVVVQIGSSSGREITWLAQKNPKHKYVGTDIYPEVVAYSAEHHNLPNLTFEKCVAKEIHRVLSRYKQKIIVFSSGSLQLVQPEHLKAFFQSLNRFPELEILLLEPGNELRGCPDGLKGSVWRGNFSYTHDYRFYAENAGLTTVESRIIRPYDENFPEHRGTIHYYYHARTSST